MMVIAMPAPPENLSASKLQIVGFGRFLSLDTEVVERLLLGDVPVGFHEQRHGFAPLVLRPTPGLWASVRVPFKLGYGLVFNFMLKVRITDE